MLCTCGQPARPRISANGPAPTLCGGCLKERKKARLQRWREKNAEVHRLNGRDWRQQNPERARELRRAYWLKNRERHLAAKRAWWWKNRDRLVEAKRAARRGASADGAGVAP
jgi:hypothetical protein